MRRGVASVVVVALLAVAAAAGAHDSEAPRHADHRWLPAETWVQKHWLPYDEADLYALLRVDTPTVFKWLHDDHRTLAQLARRRGVSPRTLAKRLMEPRRRHLTQHVLFHVFHGSHLTGHENGHIHHLFGVGRREYNRLRQKVGLSPAQIAKRNGKSTASVREHVIAQLRAEAAAGVRRGSMTRAQGDLIVARQVRVVECWLSRPAPKFDPHHPFGDKYSGHGPHRRGSKVGIKHPKPPRGCWKRLITA